MNEFQEKIRSINFGLARRQVPKRTTVDTGTVVATTTEHYHQDRQDQHVRLKPVKVKAAELPGGDKWVRSNKRSS